MFLNYNYINLVQRFKNLTKTYRIFQFLAPRNDFMFDSTEK